jgi:hypothetical protein
VNPEELQGTLHSQLGTDWKDFDRALETVKPWTGGHKKRRCTDMFACGFGFSKDTVEVQANPESMYADSVNVGTYGTILMKLVNIGKRPTSQYALQPHPIEYYLVVKHTDPTSWQWALVERGGIAPPRVGAWNEFSDCRPHHEQKKSYANYQDCDDDLKHSAIRTSSLFEFTEFHSLGKAILAFAFESPAWISCAYGCCTLAY